MAHFGDNNEVLSASIVDVNKQQPLCRSFGVHNLWGHPTLEGQDTITKLHNRLFYLFSKYGYLLNKFSY